MSTSPVPSQEARRAIYAELARAHVGEFVRVSFVPNLRSYSGTKCDGLARWSGQGHYEVLLDANLDLEREGLAAAHEIAHVKAKDPPQIAPTYLSRMMRHADARGQKTTTEQGDPHEDRAAVLGQILLLYWRVHGKINW